MLKDKNPLLDKWAAAVVQDLLALQRGDVIRTERIEELTGCQRYGEHWSSIIKKVKRLVLRSRGILLWPVHGVGYELCTTTRQLNETTQIRQRRATRQLGRSIVETEALPAEELSEFQQLMRGRCVQQLRDSRRAIRNKMRSQASVTKQSDWVPPIAVLKERAAEANKQNNSNA